MLVKSGWLHNLIKLKFLTLKNCFFNTPVKKIHNFFLLANIIFTEFKLRPWKSTSLNDVQKEQKKQKRYKKHSRIKYSLLRMVSPKAQGLKMIVKKTKKSLGLPTSFGDITIVIIIGKCIILFPLYLSVNYGLLCQNYMPKIYASQCNIIREEQYNFRIK